MRRLGHFSVDILKIDVEGSEFESIPEAFALNGSRLPARVGQLLLEGAANEGPRALLLLLLLL